MSNLIKLVIINHTFQKPQFYKRWKVLSEMHDDLDITLLAPAQWTWGKEKNQTYGHIENLQGAIVDEERFRIRLIDIQRMKLGDWRSDLLEEEIKQAKPDIVYFIGGHNEYPLMQILKLRKKEKMHHMKVLSFSMRSHMPTIDLKKEKKGFQKYIRYIGKLAIFGPKLRRFNRECDAVFCHYPDAYEAFRRDGYQKPIYIQTQVGVDPDIFYPNPESRKKIREKYNIEDAYLFGSASRFHHSKGLSEIIAALPQEGNWKYLMMGWGRDDEVEKIKAEIAERGLEDKIILTGYIDNWMDMAEHWNALDCAVHAPLSTPDWVETFSLALVQAMITGLPVIGTNTGSVPYQIGPDGIIIPERDIEAMHHAFVEMLAKQEKGQEIGAAMRKRAYESFNIYHLDELFYRTIKDILNDTYDENKVDMANYPTSC